MFYPILGQHGITSSRHSTQKCGEDCPSKGLIEDNHIHINGYYDVTFRNILSKFSPLTYLERSFEGCAFIHKNLLDKELKQFALNLFDMIRKNFAITKELNSCAIRYIDRYSVLLSAPAALFVLRVLQIPIPTPLFLVFTAVSFSGSNWMQHCSSDEIHNKVLSVARSKCWRFENIETLEKLEKYCNAVGFFRHAKDLHRKIDQVYADAVE